jgi:hypothetical protein
LLRTIIPAALFVGAVLLTPKLPDRGVREKGFFGPDTVVVVADTSMRKDSTPKEKELFSFMNAVAQLESDGNSKVVNRYGMLGKYQFHIKTLRSMGIITSRTKFLNDETLQDSAMIKYMKENRQELLPYIKKYAGKEYKGVYITESAILAGAHFAGSTGVVNFFTKNKNRRDGNGTTLTKYMSKFTGYNLDKLMEL